MSSILLPTDLPEIVALCGSSRFKDDFLIIGEALEKAGVLALMMSFFQHADAREVSPEERKVLEKVDRRRIDLVQEVWILDLPRGYCPHCATWIEHEPYPSCGCNDQPPWWQRQNWQSLPYIGESTRKEIKYALATGKPVRFHRFGFRKDEENYHATGDPGTG